MARYLVIVESPAKVKTIKKFLGSNYVVMASNGHVRDLPKSQLGIDIEHDYEPKYITIRGKGEILAALRKEVKKADKVYLATDPDREGEAISWHLSQALKLEKKKTYRISFNEITKTAVKASLKNAREIDTDLVDAQQARRVLDRIVGYKISPLLWAKVKRGLSAGRVQSVALRIIADREDKINAFIPEEFWTLDANLKVAGEKKLLKAKFYGKGNQKLTIRSKEELDQIVKDFGKIDILVNNAGVVRDGFMMLMPQKDWDEVLDTNLNGAWRWTKAVSRKMYAKKSGSIIFISSVSGLVGVGGQTNYSASKGAICALARSAAAELAAKGIRSNAICPGFIETGMVSKMPRDIVRAQKERIAMKRFGRPEEIAEVVVAHLGQVASALCAPRGEGRAPVPGEEHRRRRYDDEGQQADAGDAEARARAFGCVVLLGPIWLAVGWRGAGGAAGR